MRLLCQNELNNLYTKVLFQAIEDADLKISAQIRLSPTKLILVTFS